ncbi:Tex family protein [Motiliproteus sp. MSK22-1]|uniref:Tex family protein n=1 Tax=Motiliproteus sp. MSK22-1 TaxID=1897630 RepID=UPI0009774DEB|nr:Tex family protein [Motiliproteus sp. MSK22-1]OMH28103.1 RNA-binding transcriptional accessory protein [Motiliproteus sp. MSK22-1]
MKSISQQIAESINAQSQQVDAAISLLDEGATVPFIARYRKEVTGALDDTQLRQLQTQLVYLRDLNDRRQVIITAIEEQGKLTRELKQQLQEAETKTRLEDLYQPFKSKRRTKAQIAREAGLEPLSQQLLTAPQQSQQPEPQQLAVKYLNSEAGFADQDAVLEGAQAILVEQFSEAAELVGKLRNMLWNEGHLEVSVTKGKEQEGAKFRDYFEHSESIRKIPSHRLLAILRGKKESILKTAIRLPEQIQPENHISQYWQLNHRGPIGVWLQNAVNQCWKRKLQPQLEKELINQSKSQAEEDAILVFARNLKELLLAAPAGFKATLGLDPGLRTGVKVAVVDGTGKLLEHTTIYPHVPRNKWDESISHLASLCKKHQVELISIGNGTGSRETDKLTSELLKKHPEIKAQKLVVSEAGASVYSASELAAKEFPDLDVSIRGAVSIARRLQDPLAELVKIEPKAIGVGQYQHDVNQSQLAHSLDSVVEDCVNNVGVDLNTASEALLGHISGLNTTLARNIVDYRDQHGVFASRTALKKVPRLGPKAFEQAAGFLRITQGKQPLDGSSVHPEAYSLVQQIAGQNQRSLESLIGDESFLRNLNPSNYVNQQFGEYTVKDILKELEKPGRDPRPSFKAARFEEGVEELKDLKAGMKLEGVVTNVTNFGAFVDIGVHQDGLVHISALADRFVKDPYDVVKAGDIVQVRVLDIDIPRRRIALSMKSDNSETNHRTDSPKSPATHRDSRSKQLSQPNQRPKSPSHSQAGSARKDSTKGTMAELFSQAKKGKRL